MVPDGDLEAIHAEHNTSELSSIPDHSIFLLQLPPYVNEEALLQLLALNQDVEWVDFNISLGLSDGSTQSFFLNADIQDYLMQEAFDLLELETAQDQATGEGIVVAVVDTGVDSAHELLNGRVLSNGYNFIDMNDDTSESDGDEAFHGHGTFMAGLVTSVAPDAHILPIKVLDASGEGDVFHVAAGMLYALDEGALVLNLSLGTIIETPIMNYAMEQAELYGAVVVAAAGNLDQHEPVEFPAAHPLALAVAATELNDVKTSFSNYGTHIDLCAPGGDIVSSFPGDGYAQASGTSAAAALASGAAALLYSKASLDAAPSDIRQALKNAALDINAANPDYAGLLGSGRIRVVEALRLRKPGPDLPDSNSLINDLVHLYDGWNLCPTGCVNDSSTEEVLDVIDLLILLSSPE
jgi:subtilisin family serine protease